MICWNHTSKTSTLLKAWLFRTEFGLSHKLPSTSMTVKTPLNYQSFKLSLVCHSAHAEFFWIPFWHYLVTEVTLKDKHIWSKCMKILNCQYFEQSLVCYSTHAAWTPALMLLSPITQSLTFPLATMWVLFIDYKHIQVCQICRYPHPAWHEHSSLCLSTVTLLFLVANVT